MLCKVFTRNIYIYIHIYICIYTYMYIKIKMYGTPTHTCNVMKSEPKHICWTRKNASCCTPEWVMSHMCESCLICVHHVWYVQDTGARRHIFSQGNMMSHVTHKKESCLICVSRVSYVRVVSSRCELQAPRHMCRSSRMRHVTPLNELYHTNERVRSRIYIIDSVYFLSRSQIHSLLWCPLLGPYST